MGSFNNYVTFFWPPTYLYVDIFYAEHGHEQKLAFHFVYVVFEQPQSLELWKSLRNRNIKVLNTTQELNKSFLNVMAH